MVKLEGLDRSGLERLQFIFLNIKSYWLKMHASISYSTYKMVGTISFPYIISCDWENIIIIT